jgi:hypothetical protein
MKINAALGAGTAITPGSVDASPQFQPASRGESMVPRKSALLRGVLLAAAVLSAGVATADVVVTIDPVKNCLETNGGYFPFGASAVTSAIAAGSYLVDLRDNNMSCYYGNLTGSANNKCSIDTILLRAVNSFQAGWGLAVGARPVLVDVSAPTVFNAFVIDTPCYDNTGKATLYFKGPL